MDGPGGCFQLVSERGGRGARSPQRGAGKTTEGPEVQGMEGGRSRPVSRVLSGTVIHLGRASPRASSDLPGDTHGPRAATPGRRSPYLVLLRVGFTLPPTLPPARCALTAPFHPYRSTAVDLGGIFSVALSVGSRLPGVTWHPALRSPDFPPLAPRSGRAATVRPTPGSSIAWISWRLTPGNNRLKARDTAAARGRWISRAPAWPQAGRHPAGGSAPARRLVRPTSRRYRHRGSGRGTATTR